MIKKLSKKQPLKHSKMKRLFSYFIMLTVFSLTAQWELQDSGTTENLNDVFCLNPDTVMVVGENGTILRTTDGGTNWLPLPGITTHNLKEVQFAGATGYILGENNTLLKSTDYGASWQQLNISTSDTLTALYVSSPDTLYVCGSNGLIMRSYNGGLQWQNVNTPFSDLLIDIEVPADSVIYVLGAFNGDCETGNGKIFISENNGNTWRTYTSFISTSNLHSLESIVKIKAVNDNKIGMISCNPIGIFRVVRIQDTILERIGEADLLFLTNFSIVNDKVWLTGWDNRICTGCNNAGLIITLDYNDSLSYYPIIGSYEATDLPPYYNLDFANDTIGYVVGPEGVIRKNPTGGYGFDINAITLHPFNIIPNPAGETFRIDFKFPMKNTRLEIYNSTGELIHKQKISDHETVNVAELPAGAYIVQIKSERYVSSQKLIKK